MEIDWEDIYLRLLAFARSLTRDRPWFRGERTTSFLMGKEWHDYAMEAITRYMEHPEKFDPEKGDFFDYLKWSLARSLVTNDLRKNENRLTSDIFGVSDDDEDDDDDSTSYADRVLPHTEALFVDDVDYNAIKEFIEGTIKDDKNAENIFLGVYGMNLKRREVMDEFGMSPNDYDNGIRRLKTVINQAVAHFNPNKKYDTEKKSKQV